LRGRGGDNQGNKAIPFFGCERADATKLENHASI